MKQTIKITLISSVLVNSFLFANGINFVKDFKYYPVPKAYTSISRGGTLPDSIAASDGVGTLLIHNLVNSNEKGQSNKAFNAMIKKNKKVILDNPNTSISSLINSNIITNVSITDLNKINSNKLVNHSVSQTKTNTLHTLSTTRPSVV